MVAFCFYYRCESFSDDDLQGLLIANEKCYRLDEEFIRNPGKKASLPRIRATKQQKSEQMRNGTSVGRFLREFYNDTICILI